MTIIGACLLILGLFFFLATTIGILRLPDFYARMHAAGIGDSLASVLMLLGLAVYNLHHFSGGALVTSVKIMLVCVFVYLASPTGTHAVIDAGFAAGAKPWTKEEGDLQ